MKVLCPTCHQPVRGEDIDVARGVGVCRPCGEVVPLVAGPADLRCVERRDGDAWSFALAPPRMMGLYLLAVAAVWCGFLTMWYRNALRQSNGFSMWFTLPHVGAGVVLIWLTLRMLFNRARIELTRDTLRVVEGPIPSFGRVREPTAGIERFAAGESTSFMPLSFPRPRNKPTWTVLVVMRDARSLRFPLFLDREGQALWLAARLNDALAAANTPPVPLTYRG